MKKVWKVLLIVISVFAVFMLVFLIFISRGLNIKNDTFRNVEISKIQDGIYQGEYTGNRFGNEVQVTIAGGEITEIELIKDMMVPLEGVSTSIFDEVKAEQTLQVDAVSGATVSSKGYLKALEDAISGK